MERSISSSIIDPAILGMFAKPFVSGALIDKLASTHLALALLSANLEWVSLPETSTFGETS